MKRPLKTLPLATAAMLAAASLPAKSFVTPPPITGTGTPVIEIDGGDDRDVYTTSGFETIAFFMEGSHNPVPINNLTVSYLMHGAPKVHHGSPGVTYRFENTATYERKFRLFDNGIDQSALVTKSFTLPPGGSVEFTLFMPLASERGSRARWHRSGITLEETTPGKDRKSAHYAYPQQSEFCGKSNSDPSLLLSANVSAKKMHADLTAAMRQHNYNRRHKKDRSYYSSHSSGKAEPESYTFSGRKFKFAPEGWPRDWRCYSTYDAIVITAGEYGALPDEVKSALNVYRLLGGAVIVTGGQDGFANTMEAARALSEIDDSFDALTGDLEITSYYYSYGSSSDILVKNLGYVPIETKATLPLKTLLALLAAFALVVVPLTVFRSVRRNARIKLLFLLPAASAAIAIAVAAFAYAFFGVTPYVRLQSVTILDQQSKRAFTRGQFGIYTPVSIGSSLAFPLDAAFRMRHAHSEDVDTEYAVEVSDVQRLANGWTSPLVSSFFDFERACERSERLDFHVSPSGDVKVVNLLGATISAGYANVGGQIYKFNNLPAGGEKKADKLAVKPRAASKPRYPFTSSTAFGRDWKECIRFMQWGETEAQPGEYVALVEGSPFFPNPLTGRKSHASEAGLVFGRFKEVAE